MPASFEQVNRTVVGIASLQALEPKTSRADWLHYLDLDAPPKGNGVLITLMDDGTSWIFSSRFSAVTTTRSASAVPGWGRAVGEGEAMGDG